MCSWLLHDVDTYNPDTLDLTKDADAAAYWFPCFQELIKKFTTIAAKSQAHLDPNAHQRAEEMCQSYLEQLKQYEEEQSKISIRELLELIDFELRRYGFPDPWLQQKQSENDTALTLLPQRLDQIDHIKCHDARWTELVRGVIAGNMFDSGAAAVSLLLKENHDFGLDSALQCIEQRPWLIDNLDELLQRLRQSKPHKCAAIFVDNSGVDIILGILPFAREFVKRGTKVLLCANSAPSLNDVTAVELEELLKRCPCAILTEALANKQLLVYENGQRGPCLDMRKLPADLCRANDIDLLVIEGMGRALHTNFYAQFNCETIKLLVIKNKWLAERLGGKTFSAICKYETVS